MNFARLVRIAADSVSATQGRLPPEIRELARAVPIHYESAPASHVLAEGFEPDILGLFTGSPHGSEFAEANLLPPQIILYINNLWDCSDGDAARFKSEARLTYLHELGHYFGWDEDELAARGLE
jgi:predicted Zn-dependent protease with MMP-like domain